MRILRLFLILFLFLVKPIGSKSQISDSYPTYFHDFSADKSIENPSFYNHEDKYILKTHYKSFFGLQSKIKTYNIGAYLLTKRNHRLGVRLQSDNEGDLIQRNRLNLVYAINKALSKNVEVAFSGYLGGLFYGFSSVGNFQGGNDQSLDLGFAASLNYKFLKIGVATNQLNQPVLQPLTFQYAIRRYIDLLVEYQFSVSEKWDMFTTVKYRKTHFNDPDIAQLHTRLTSENERYSFGVSYLFDLGFSPCFGISIPYDKASKQFVQVNFSFFMAANNDLADPFIDKQYELSLGWKFKK